MISSPEGQAQLLAETIQTIVSCVVPGSIIVRESSLRHISSGLTDIMARSDDLSVPFFLLIRGMHSRIVAFPRSLPSRRHAPPRSPASPTGTLRDIERGAEGNGDDADKGSTHTKEASSAIYVEYGASPGSTIVSEHTASEACGSREHSPESVDGRAGGGAHDQAVPWLQDACQPATQ